MSAPPKLNFSKSPQSRTGIVLLAFLIIAAFFLIAEHTAHLFGVLPYALLLLSLLLFLFIRQEQNDNRGPDGDHPEDRQ